ncbi:MAG: hypothetical protein AAGJ54_06920 [Planctomycetota bacterium]
MRRRAITIIEMLVVVVLITTVAGVFALSLSATSTATRADAVLAAAIDLDRRARLAASSGSGDEALSIQIDEEHLQLRSGRDDDKEFIASVPVPSGVELTITIEGAPVESVIYDARGRCESFVLIVSCPAYERRADISGVTGWTEPAIEERSR